MLREDAALHPLHEGSEIHRIVNPHVPRVGQAVGPELDFRKRLDKNRQGAERREMITEKMMKDFVVKLAQYMESHPEKFFVMCLDDLFSQEDDGTYAVWVKAIEKETYEQGDKENRLDA